MEHLASGRRNEVEHPLNQNYPAQVADNRQMAEDLPVSPIASQKIENQQMQPVLDLMSTDVGEDEEYFPLTGKPYFHVILAKSHVGPLYQLYFPTKILKALPLETVPMIVKYFGKTWETKVIRGASKHVRVDSNTWGKFIADNRLKMGDAVVFELAESSSAIVKFRVQILRGGLPEELLAKVNGKSEQTAMIID